MSSEYHTAEDENRAKMKIEQIRDKIIIYGEHDEVNNKTHARHGAGIVTGLCDIFVYHLGGFTQIRVGDRECVCW